jgi:hypothetical protein
MPVIATRSPIAGFQITAEPRIHGLLPEGTECYWNEAVGIDQTKSEPCRGDRLLSNRRRPTYPSQIIIQRLYLHSEMDQIPGSGKGEEASPVDGHH